MADDRPAAAVDLSTVISAERLNWYTDNSIPVFTSTGQRDAAIPSPEDGMSCYLDVGTELAGLYQWTGTAWRPPWNTAWGMVPCTLPSTTNVTTSGTTETLLKSTTVTLVANRRYRVTLDASAEFTDADSIFTVRLRLTSTAGTELKAKRVTSSMAGAQQPVTIVAGMTGSGSTVIVYSGQRTGVGSGTLGTLAGFQAEFIVEDMGPSGGPT